MRRPGLIVIASAFAFLGVGSSLLANDIHVPADSPTIQAAIDAAVDGDVVLVSPGTYVENIDFKGKAITVTSSDGAPVTTIDGGKKGSVVTFATGEGSASVLTGFTIVNGSALNGGGIYCRSSSPTILSNRITGNTASSGGAGIWCSVSSATISANTIFANTAAGDSGGITLISSSVTITDNVIAGNVAQTGRGGAIGVSASTAVLTNNTFADNSSNLSGGAIAVISGSSFTVTNCIFWGDTPDEIEVDSNSSAAVTYCDVAGGSSGQGNLDADPLFVGPTSGDYHVMPVSPCVDVGSASAPGLPSTDVDGEPRTVGVCVDLGADEVRSGPIVDSVALARTRYDRPLGATIDGDLFTAGTGTEVFFGGAAASNVVVVDDQTITCDVPAGEPGPVDVTVSNSLGSGILPGGFIYTPAIHILGTPRTGSTITVEYLCDPSDGLFAIYGLPPPVSIPTPPYHGDLCILPSNVLFYVPSWPFDHFDLVATIPDDPRLAGVNVLLQALVGPSLTNKPKDGAWTNCAVLAIE